MFKIKKELKVNYVNDLHLDFYCQFKTNQIKYKKSVLDFAKQLYDYTEDKGEVLIISGDFGHLNIASYWFLEEISKYYEKVVITYGNHDLYILSKSQKKKYGNSKNRVFELYTNVGQLSNVHFLGEDFDGILDYKGYRFGGDILMSNPKSDMEIMFYKEVMNDSNYINLGYYKNENATYLNNKNIRYYEDLKSEDLDVFISHYPTILTNSHLRHGISDGSLGSYRTEVKEFIAKYNFFGHIHEQETYKQFGHEFLTYALGYPSEKLNKNFGYIELN